MTLACWPTRSIHRSTDIGWRRSRSCARSIAQAAARPARSLSANDSTAMSPGGWPRSRGSTMSSSDTELVASRCILQPKLVQQCAGDRGAIDAFQSDDDELAGARLVRAPRPVVVMGDARADRLHEESHRLAGHRRKTL